MCDVMEARVRLWTNEILHDYTRERSFGGRRCYSMCLREQPLRTKSSIQFEIISRLLFLCMRVHYAALGTDGLNGGRAASADKEMVFSPGRNYLRQMHYLNRKNRGHSGVPWGFSYTVAKPSGSASCSAL